jgi:hypothetical protein
MMKLQLIFYIIPLFLLTNIALFVKRGEAYHDDEGPLILTPYIESGDVKKAQNLSRVWHYEPHFESYSGYLTIQPSFGSNIFFWFFPAKVKLRSMMLLDIHIVFVSRSKLFLWF